MRDYNHLTPSEVAYIINEGEVTQLEHYYFTFMDLLLKRVLQVPKGFMVKPDVNKNFELETFIMRGPNYTNYYPLAHESIFTDIFQDNPELRTTILNNLKFAYKKQTFYETINDLIKKYDHLNEYHKHARIFNLLKSSKLSGKGLILSTKLEQSLQSFQYLANDDCENKKIEDAIHALDTKIILIPDLNFDLLINWSKENNNSTLPFTNKNLKQDRLSDFQFENIKAIDISFQYFYDKMILAIEQDNEIYIGSKGFFLN
jgi:hypothetical protein